MRRATEVGIRRAMEPYYRVEKGINVISRSESVTASSVIMSEFSGVYCSTLPTKAGTYVFSVVSVARSRRKFFTALVR